MGLYYAIGFLLPEERGKLGSESLRIKKFALPISTLWIALVVANSIVELSNILGGSFSDSLNFGTWWSFLTSTSIGRDFIFQFIMGVLALWITARA